MAGWANLNSAGRLDKVCRRAEGDRGLWGMKDYHLDRWDDVRYALAVARAGSFLGAGEMLATSHSTVSRRIQFLEQRLGTKLFDRRAHGLQITQSGRELVAHAEEMERAVLCIERSLAGADHILDGLVKVSAPEGLLTHWLVPMLRDFRQARPSINVDLLSGTGPIDLASRHADIAIRMVRPTEPGVVAKRIGRIGHSLFAASAYLAEHGTPESLAALAGHWIVEQTYTIEQIDGAKDLLPGHQRIAGRFDSSSGYVAAIRSGYGIGLLADYYRVATPDLVPLDIETDCSGSFYILSHEESNRSARIRAVLDYLAERIRKDLGEWLRE